MLILKLEYSMHRSLCDIKISKHLKKRMKDRIGLPFRAHGRHISKVLWRGYKLISKTGEMSIYYQGYKYLFLQKGDKGLIGITVYPSDLPSFIDNNSRFYYEY